MKNKHITLLYGLYKKLNRGPEGKINNSKEISVLAENKLELGIYSITISPFNTCTAALKLPRHYPEEMYVRTKMV